MASITLTRVFNRKYTWIYLGILTLLVRLVFSRFPNVAEQLYARGFYRGIRWIMEHTFGLLPFHSFWILIPLLIFIIVYRWRKGRGKDKGNWKRRLLRTGRHLLSLASAIVFLFFFLWGFNYQRLSIENQLGLVTDPAPEVDLPSEISQAGWLAEGARLQIPGITADTLSDALAPEDLESKVAADLKVTLNRLGFPASGQGRARIIQPGGWMLSFGVAGIHNPFTGEGNVSGGLTDVQIPFTMAHEMSHGYGFGDEGTCNFLALMACLQSTDPYIRYSGRMEWWDKLSSSLRRADPDKFKEVYQDLPKGFKTDWIAIRYNRRRYQGRASTFGSKVNDRYLKLQGVQGGIKSYRRVVLLYLAWQAKFL